METITPSAALASQPAAAGQRHGGALCVITTLFFMMGLITSLNDVLIPHLKAIYTLN
jgi:FHS family L-fucose permease-like MFS transporter